MHVEVLDIIGRYEIVGELGNGAMSRVFLANDPNLDRKVAVKVILQGVSLDNKEQGELERRFLLEARAAGKLSHPGIVRVYDADKDPNLGIPYIAMEWVQGGSLRNLLDEGGCLDGIRTLDILSQVGRALDYAHRAGRIHRDIKPSNILIGTDGTAKVSDFGVAKIVSETHTVSGQILGTPAYMSPEQIKDEPLDGRSDLFSLGAVLYQCVSGAPPFGGDSLVQVVYKILNVDPRPLNLASTPALEELAAVASRSLDKDPNRRFQSGLEFADALDRIRTAMTKEPGVDFRWQHAKRTEQGASNTIPTLDARSLAAETGPEQTHTVQLSTASIHRAAGRESVRRDNNSGDLDTVITTVEETVAHQRIRGWQVAVTAVASAGLLLIAIGSLLRSTAEPVTQPTRIVFRSTAEITLDSSTGSSLEFPERAEPDPGSVSSRPAPAPKSSPIATRPAPGTKSTAAEITPEPIATANIDPPLPPTVLTPVTILYRHKGGLAFLSIALDGQRVWSQELKPVEGRLQRLTGYEARAVVPVPSGSHTLQVNLSDPSRRVNASQSIKSRYTKGARRKLRVSVDPSDNALQLRWKE